MSGEVDKVAMELVLKAHDSILDEITGMMKADLATRNDLAYSTIEAYWLEVAAFVAGAFEAAVDSIKYVHDDLEEMADHKEDVERAWAASRGVL